MIYEDKLALVFFELYIIKVALYGSVSIVLSSSHLDYTNILWFQLFLESICGVSIFHSCF